MKNIYELFNTILSILKIPVTGWIVAVFIVLYFLRNLLPLQQNGEGKTEIE